MLDMTLDQGQQVFLNALAGNNFSTESVRAYSADITQFIAFLQSVRVDWNNPKKLERLDSRWREIHNCWNFQDLEQ
jgi:site-specific recombinase XerD